MKSASSKGVAVEEVNPSDATNRGQFNVFGEVAHLKEFAWAMHRAIMPGLRREYFDRQYSENFEALSVAEDKREPLRLPNAQMDVSCERFILRSSYSPDGHKVRDSPSLVYLNRYDSRNFGDMSVKLTTALQTFVSE